MNYYALEAIRGNRSGGLMTRVAWKKLALCAALLTGGCAGELNDPDAFIGGTEPELKDAETILAESCGTNGCHDDVAMQSNLDLLSPGVESRVVGVGTAEGTGCGGRTLVVAGEPSNSYLLDKILFVPGTCGGPMPIIGSLEPDEVETIRQWIVDLGGS